MVKKKTVKMITKLSLWLLVAGGINLLIVTLLKFDIIGKLATIHPMVETVANVLIGISAVLIGLKLFQEKLSVK